MKMKSKSKRRFVKGGKIEVVTAGPVIGHKEDHGFYSTKMADPAALEALR
jgi:hypothetical protein